MKVDYSNTIVSEAQILYCMQSLSGYISEVRKSKEFFANNWDDTQNIEQIKETVHKLNSPSLKWIFLIGIGGSDLGAQAIYWAMKGFRQELLQIRFIDTVSSRQLDAEVDFIKTFVSSTDEFVVNIISKSGTTTETLANASIILNELKSKFGKKALERVVVTTDRNSKLWNSKLECERLEIHKNTGGRFSVFSAAGLFPLMLSGINIDTLLQGAIEERKLALEENSANSALASATIQYIYYKAGLKISNTFIFNKELEYFGKWYRQLVAESLGKKVDLDTKEVREGITPIISIGTTDLHSQAQLYFGGPKDKFTSLVYFNDPHSLLVVPKLAELKDITQNVSNKRLEEIMGAILGGVKQAYINNGLPFMSIEFDLLDEYSLARLMSMKMFEIVFLAKLMNVNAFDQPGVEEYKKETKRLLNVE